MSVVIVSGALANKHHNGGAAWTRLNWIRGLQQLGFDVYFVEQIEAQRCVDSNGGVVPFDASENRRYFADVVRQMALDGRAALLCDSGDQIEGLPLADLLGIAEASEFLVNISGHLTYEPIRRRVRRQVYVDLDPGFTQLWSAGGSEAARLQGHQHYFTVGENIGTSACSIPTGGIDWKPVRQPVVLSDWPVATSDTPDRFTTVGTWRGPYGPVEFGGRTFGLKVHEFRKFVQLPRQVPASFELALEMPAAEDHDRQLLRDHGWHVVDARTVAADPVSFRQYVQSSGAEFSAAQGMYVEANTGWFSDRTVRYLASGKPALVQDTGFSQSYRGCEGLIPFRTMADAVAGAERILRDYEAHAQAARSLAEERFEATKVLGDFVDQVRGAHRQPGSRGIAATTGGALRT